MRRGALAAGALALLLAAAWRWKALPRAAGDEAQAKLALLEEVLRGGNDNDPRLDRDFQGLSPRAKELFRAKYRGLPPERRNERGTIVYLLGMNLASAEDWAFLREVVSEPVCLSLSDCSKRSSGGAPGEDVTLAYPSLVALRQAQRVREQAAGVVEAARSSRAPAVARMMARLEKR